MMTFSLKFQQIKWLPALQVAIAYGILGWLSIGQRGLQTNTAPIWLAAGVGLASLILEGKTMGVGIFLGDLGLRSLWGYGLGGAIPGAIITTFTTLLAFKLLQIFQFSPHLARIRDVVLLVLLGGLIPAVLYGFLQAVLEQVLRTDTGNTFFQQRWFLGLSYGSGILLITPLLLRLQLIRQGRWQKSQERSRFLEAAMCFGLLITLGWIIFASKHLAPNPFDNGMHHAQYLEFLPYPLVVWAAIRFPTWGAVLSTLVVSSFAIAGTLQGKGSFILQSQNLPQAFLVLQTFIIITATTTLLLSAAIAERQRIEHQLRTTLERDRLLAEIALKIRQSLELGEILQTTVTEVRKLLQVDRVYIGFVVKDTDHFEVVAESVTAAYPSLLQVQAQAPKYEDISKFLPKTTLIAENIQELDLLSPLKAYYQHYQIQSVLAVPLVAQDQTLGLLVAHQCSRLRHWQKGEVRLLEQLATQVAIAVQQAQLYQQVQTLNCNLEKQVKARTLELEDRMLELEDLQEMKAIFLQAVSHDLRTSMMGLLMLLKNLQNRPCDNITLSRSILERMIQSGDRQLTLLNALSENHFNETRPLPLNCQPVALKPFLDHLLAEWRSLFIQNQATIVHHLSDHFPPIFADPQLLKQVFDNLLTNALKHNPLGIELTIEASLEKNLMRLVLKDNGIGMEQQQCEKLFQLCPRNVHNQRLTGIGLGCYQCRQIIEAHGGSIGVSSTPQQGTQVWFTLPIAQSKKSVI
ncbi:MAG: MASE1 domain-containing protein [Snowella sp.]|nr:MASE1 domain-containing protein [Snowella sp.]